MRDRWEINYGYLKPITVNCLKGFDYLFYLLNRKGERIRACEVINLFSEKKYDNDDQATETIRKGKRDAINHLVEIEDIVGVGNEFSALLHRLYKEEKRDGEKFVYFENINIPDKKIIGTNRIL